MGGRSITNSNTLDISDHEKRETSPFFRIPWLIGLLGLIALALILANQREKEPSTEVLVAVVDTGIDLKQRKLKKAVLDGTNIIDLNLPPQDDNGHGTQVASVIHALEPYVKIVPIKAIARSGVATKQELAQGIVAAVDFGARIINVSAGVDSSSPDLENAVRYAEEKGVLIVAAAGSNQTTIQYPAAFPYVIAVGAVDRDGVRLQNSPSGPALDLFAVGEYATLGLRGQCITASGTSTAAPAVSAAIATILLREPHLKPNEVRERLNSSLTDIGEPGRDDATGLGLLTDRFEEPPCDET